MKLDKNLEAMIRWDGNGMPPPPPMPPNKVVPKGLAFDFGISERRASAENLRQQMVYDINMKMYNKLLALHEKKTDKRTIDDLQKRVSELEDQLKAKINGRDQ